LKVMQLSFTSALEFISSFISKAVISSMPFDAIANPFIERVYSSLLFKLSVCSDSSRRSCAVLSSISFSGLDLSYYEPTDRLIIYLELHREGNQWINPYTKDIIIKTGDIRSNSKSCNEYLAVRKSELIDYLAARKCGLLVLRYSDRVIETPVELIGLPKPYNDKTTTHGRQSWIIDKGISNRNKNMYFSRLWESFWIDPASQPRRWDAQPPEEFKDGVPFILDNGETATYKQDGKDQYFKLLSFNPSVFKTFTSMPNNIIVFHCLSNLALNYSDGSSIDGCINREGQFQAFFGSVAKLDIEKQRQLSAFSEPRKAKPSYEFFRVYVEGNWPETIPFSLTLSSCLNEVNASWGNKFGETLLNTPKDEQIPIALILGPGSDDFNELADIMLELQKAVIKESKIENIKKQLNYKVFAKVEQAYDKMRSIGFTRLFFKSNRSDQTEAESYILKAINQLRQCKGHAQKDIMKVLNEFSIPETSPRFAFLHIMAEFCSFILAFKKLTNEVLKVAVEGSRHKNIDPWQQLRVARDYFLNPY